MLADIDRRLLDVLCTHRVVRQDQLCRLFPHIPERTLRYRTRRLHDLGLAGRSRPYREHGSAPNHHWPTRRADCLMRGEPAPRGGERRQPNPLFLAHAAALTEFYVAVYTTARAAGFKGLRYGREGDARETFKDGARERALAPDATLALIDEQDRDLRAFVEIDLGTMSHARLRAKAELYAAYTASDAWRTRHPFLPALLFLTTTDIRAGKFLKALARSLSHGPRSNSRHAFVVGAAGIVWAPHRLLSQPCFADLDGHTGLTLPHILNTARAPYEQALAHQQERRQADEERLRVLRDDPSAMREHMRRHESSLRYLHALGLMGEQTMRLLLTATTPPDVDERAVLGSIARDLDTALLEPGMNVLPPPGPSALSDIKLLAGLYRARQDKLTETLAEHQGDGPSLHQARQILRDGGLIDRGTLDRLPADAERDAAGRQAQAQRRVEYLVWRERAARQLARKAGPLGRLTHRPEDFYPQLDRERLKFCGHCKEIAYPVTRADSDVYGGQRHSSCHYCEDSSRLRSYTEQPPSPTEHERRSAQP